MMTNACKTTQETNESIVIHDQTANSSNSKMEITLLKGKFFNHPSFVIWIEDMNGNYIKTIFITKSYASGIFGYKMIGDQVHSSVLADLHVKYNDWRIFGEGAYRSMLIGESKGKDGLVICHKNMYEIVDNNVDFYGRCIELTNKAFPLSMNNKAKKYFGYLPDYYKFYIPESISFDPSDDLKKEKIFVSSLITEIESTSRENRVLRASIEKRGTDADSDIDRSTAIVKNVAKALKKGKIDIVEKK